MDRSHRAQHATRSRRGLTTPLVAVALIVAMLGIALLLDRLWLASAKLELISASEAGALAAAQSLVDDDRLRDVVMADLHGRARDAAVEIAAENLVAGGPVTLDREHDVRFLRPELTPDGERTALVETLADPTHVLIRGQRTRFRANPVALFMQELTRQPTGDVIAEVVARLDNHVLGVRPFADVEAPALPLAIWLKDPAKQRKDTWDHAINDRNGEDRWSYNSDTQHVVQTPDGIPELTLRTQRRGGPAHEANVQVLDLGTDLDPSLVAQQILLGWTREQLADRNGEFRAKGTECRGVPQLKSAELNALEEMIGVQRMAVLYSTATVTGQSGFQSVQCVDLVAIRILTVEDRGDGSCRVTVQPTAMTSRTLLTSGDDPVAGGGNPYLYRTEIVH